MTSPLFGQQSRDQSEIYQANCEEKSLEFNSNQNAKKDRLAFRIVARITTFIRMKICPESAFGKRGRKAKCALNEITFSGDESTVLDSIAVLPDDVFDGGEETKAMGG